MSEPLSREEAREMISVITGQLRANTILLTAIIGPKHELPWGPLQALHRAEEIASDAEDRASDLLERLSQPQSLGSTKE